MKKVKMRRKIEILFLGSMILLTSIYTFLPMNFSNSLLDDLKEEFTDSDDFKQIDSFNKPKLGLLGEDPWWNSSWKCRMLINVTNPYPYDFENYGVSVTFNYMNLGQNIQSSLNDIRIVENGTLRKNYVKKDYPTIGLATVWFDTDVNDTVAGNDVETDTYMYFGNEVALNAEAIDPSDSFGWVKNGDFELDINYTSYFDPYGWTFSHDPIDSIHGEANPGVTDENSYGVEFSNRLVDVDSIPEFGSGERVYNGNISYKFGAATSTVQALSDIYNSYAGAFFSYPFTVPKVYGAGIDLHLYRNARTWGFITNSPIDDDGYYIRLCNNYGSDPDTHTDIGVGFENYIEIWGGRAFTTGPAQKINSWQHPTKVRNWDKSVTKDTYSTSDIDGELTGPLNFTISIFEGDTIFLELGVWGQEDKYHSGFFQIDNVRFNYTDISASINELQYINSTVTIVTRDVDGRIVPNAEVMLIDGTVPKGSPGYQLAYGISDSKGRVTFSGLENRRYNITANYTLGTLEREVFNSFDSGVGPYYFNGIFYTVEIFLDLWTIDFEIVDWDGIPLNLGYIEVKESFGGELLKTLTLDENGKAMFRWLNRSDYFFRVYYDNDDYFGSPLLLNESYIYRSDYDKNGEKYQEYSIWVNQTNTNSPGETRYSINEYIYTNGSRTEFGNKKIIKVNISLSNMNYELEDIYIYYIDKNNNTGTSNHLIYFEDEYDPGEDYDFIELDIPLIENSKLKSENYQVYGVNIVVNGRNYSLPCNGIIKVETVETCNVCNRTHLSRMSIRVIDGYGDPKSALIKITNSNGQSLINLTGTGYMYDTYGLPFWYLKGYFYNITIDAYGEENIEFNITNIDPPQGVPSGKIKWYNHNFTMSSSIIFTVFLTLNTSNYLTSFANSSGTEKAYWGESLSFSVIFEYTDDNGQNWYPITDPSTRCTLYIRSVGATTDLIKELMVHGTGAGNFTINIDSSLLSAGGTSLFYNVKIEGSYPGFPSPNNINFLVEVKSIPTKISAYDYDTQLELPDKVYTTYYDECISIMVKYSIIESGSALENARLTYKWLGLSPISFYADPVYAGFYTFTLDTSDAQTTGIKVISITASYENYTTQSNFLVYLNILERRTTLNEQTGLVYLNPKVNVQDPNPFIFTYRDVNTLNIVGDLTIASYTWQELDEDGNIIPDREGSGSLTQNANKTYTLDFKTELRSVGYYFIYVTLQKENYEAKSALINLEIQLREFYLDIANIKGKSVKVTQGENIEFVVNLIDLSRNNQTLENASVVLQTKGNIYHFNETSPGIYMLTFRTNNIDAFFAPNTFSGIIKIQKTNFTTQEIYITITVKMEEIFPGMPTFYFILITSAIAGVAISLIAYRVIQQARIPGFVKKIRKVKNVIKSKKLITESYSIPTKEEMTAKLFGAEWKEIEMSLDNILGISELKSRKTPINHKISKDGGVIE